VRVALLSGSTFTDITVAGDVHLTGSGAVVVDNGVLYLNSARDRYLQWSAGTGQYILGSNADLVTSAGRTFYHTANIGSASVSHATSADSATTATTASTASAISDGAVSTTAKLVDGVVATAKLADGAVTNVKIADNVIQAGKIAPGTLTDAQFATANKDGAAGLASLRTLGAGALQAAAGTHVHSLSGTYSGGAPDPKNPTTGFAPSLTMIYGSDGTVAMLVGTGTALTAKTGAATFLSSGSNNVANGFQVQIANAGPNQSGVSYQWVSFR